MLSRAYSVLIETPVCEAEGCPNEARWSLFGLDGKRVGHFCQSCSDRRRRGLNEEGELPEC